MNMTGWESVLVLPVDPDRDHIRGPIDAPVSLVEYGDYQCPFCGAAHPILKALESRMGDSMHFVFRHFPLTTMHQYAQLAAEAAEAAGAQGRFWEMHDVLFENQQQLAPPYLVAYARALGLDVDLFEQQLADHVFAPKVREDFLSGVRSGVNGTPTLFINGVCHDGGWEPQPLLAALQRAAAQGVRA
jgi:protein-disulfide isomerase